MWCIINVDSPLSVDSQCKLMHRATEMKINIALLAHVAREGLFLYSVFNIERQNRHKSFLLHCVLLNRYNFVLVNLLQCKC